MKFWKRYVFTLIITIALFMIAFYLSSKLAQKKIDEVRVIQDKISTDILSTETRFMLLGSSSCKHFEANESFEFDLNNELSDMARRVKFMENQLGSDDAQVTMIKNQYVLLQIKDYILRKELASRCGTKTAMLLYFHDTDCKDCKEQSIILDEIHDRYPDLRIYWFDNSSDTPALKALQSMFSVKSFPMIVINEKEYPGFQSLESMTSIFDKIFKKKLDANKKDSSIKDTTNSTTDLNSKEKSLTQ